MPEGESPCQLPAFLTEEGGPVKTMRTKWVLAALILIPAPGFLILGCRGEEGGPDHAGSTSLPSAEEARAPDVLAVTRLATDFMDALSSRDTERLDEMLAPQARLFSIREGQSGPIYGVRTREEFLEGLAGAGSAFRERIWEPVVEVSGRIAMVWAPYDFHLDGELSHCGIDVLALMKMEEGWKVTSITYNVVREGCEPSPLREPGG